jgi:hypothetical protein
MNKCLAKGCYVELPKWTNFCEDHIWMNTVEVATGRAVTRMLNGRYQGAIDELEVALRKLREARDA